MDIHTLPKPETHLIKTSNNVTITASQTKNQTLEFNRKRANPNLLGLVFSEFFLGDFPGGLLLAATVIIVTVVGVMLTLRAPVAAAAAAASSFLAPPRVPWLR